MNQVFNVFFHCIEYYDTKIYVAAFDMKYINYSVIYTLLSYDVASGSEITPFNRIDKPLVVYRFTGNVMTSITTLRA